MIFVAAGTHHQPFDRLVEAAERLAAAVAEPVVIQRGASRRAAVGCEVVDVMTAADFEARLRQARVVVLHAGSSSFLQARAFGRVPIVVPRRPEHGEHVDDHQVRFARCLPADEAVVVDPEGLVDAVRRHEEARVDVDPDARSVAFCARFASLAEEIVSRRR